MKLFQTLFMKLLKSRCDSYKASKWKGRRAVLPGLFHWSVIGQWSEPMMGKIEAERSPPKWLALSESRNISNHEEIWWGPALLLFQVKAPLLKARSMSLFFWMNFFKCQLSLSSLLLPPLFFLQFGYHVEVPPPPSWSRVGGFFQHWLLIEYSIRLSYTWLPEESIHLLNAHVYLSLLYGMKPEWSACSHAYWRVWLSENSKWLQGLLMPLRHSQ